MTTATLYPARKKRLSDLLASIETFVTVKFVRNRGQIMKVKFAISDRISCFISVRNNVIFMIYVCNVFKKINNNVCDGQKLLF